MFHHIASTITTSILSAANSTEMMTLQMMRNQYYRVCIWRKSKVAIVMGKTAKLRKQLTELKDKIKNRSNNLYNNAMFICYDSQVAYYGLSPEAREIIEQIIGLNF